MLMCYFHKLYGASDTGRRRMNREAFFFFVLFIVSREGTRYDIGYLFVVGLTDVS